jgi:hypothetical protein
MRIGMSWPLGHGKRMWISGGPLAWLIGYLAFCAFGIIWIAVWIPVVIVQLAIAGIRAIVRARSNRK